MTFDFHYLVLGLASLLGETFGTIFGGGSFITQPALLALGYPPRVAVANDIAAAAFSDLFFVWHLSRRQKIDIEIAKWMIPVMAVGAVLGGCLLSHIPEGVETWIILLACMAGLIYTLFRLHKPIAEHDELGRRPKNWQALSVIMGFALGMYDGVSGAGSAILIITSLGLLFQKNMKSTILLGNMLGFVSLSATSVTFWLQGLLDWHLLLIMIPVSSLAGVFASKISNAVSEKVLRITFAAIVGGLVIYLILKKL